MKSIILQQLAKEKSKEVVKKAIKKSVTKNMTKEQFEKIRKAKKQTNDLAKKNNIEVGTGKYGVLNNKLNKSIGDKNLSEANKIMKDMKDFIKNIKDKPKVRKGQFASYKEARDAAMEAGKKTFNFGGKKNIPVTRIREKKADLSDLQKGMSKEEKKKFKANRDNELNKLKKAQLNDIMADKYGGQSAYGGVRVQKLTPEGEKLLNEGKLNVIVNAQKFIKMTKVTKKNGKTITKRYKIPTNKYVVEGIDAPLIPKGAKPIGANEKKKMNEYFNTEMTDSQRLDYIRDNFEPQYTASQLADILGITARDLTATLKKSGKFKQIMGNEGLLPKEGFQTKVMGKDMKTGGMVKYKAGTGKKTIGSKLKKYGKAGAKGTLGLANKAMNLYMPIEILDLMTSAAFKKGTQGKTIRGVGKAIRGYGKAMIKGRKK